jgi:nucleoside transporter
MSTAPEDDPESLLTVVPPEQIPVPAPVPEEVTHVGVDLRSKIGVKLAILMFLHHFSVGAWIVTLSSYINANAGDAGLAIFTAGFVGKVYSAGPLGGMISPFITGFLADHYFSTERLMVLLNIGAAAALYWAINADSQSTFYLAALAYHVCFIPSFALATSMSLHHLKRPERDFPVIRACSTSGWVVAGFFVGWFWPWMTGSSIEATATPMKIALVGQLLTAAFCLVLPHTPPTNRRAAGQGGGFSLAATVDLLKNSRFLFLLALAVLAHAPPQFYYSYLNVYLNTWIDMTDTAAKMALGQVVEVCCMIFLPALLLRISVKTSILIGLAIWTLRLWILSVSASPEMWGRTGWIYFVILIHGFAFTLVSISLQLDVDRCAGRKRRATAQGLLAVSMSGFGSFIGAGISGEAGARWLPAELEYATAAGWQSFWLLPTILMGGVFVITALFLPQDKKQQ